VSLVSTNPYFPHSLSQTPNRMCWNTYWYLKQSECQFIPGPTDGGTEFNITTSLVRGRLRHAPTTVDPSSATKQQPLRNCIVAYSRNSRSLCPVVHGGKQCARGLSRRKVWSRDPAHRDGGFQTQHGARYFQTATWKYKIFLEDTRKKTRHDARIQTVVLLWRYLSQ
jgi:hypothetical protein